MLGNYFQQNIRNFCIVAHIDHGKSTLADRFLEFTQTVEKRNMKEQIIDQMDLERERGITIKLQPVTMKLSKLETPQSRYAPAGQARNLKRIKKEYTLNLIDTPGHVDFNYEVSRSLAAVEGAILLVDATKGVQAQTLSNLYLAIEQDLTIIPVVNKIDLPNANIEKTKKEIVHILGCKEEDILAVSGKTGAGVGDLLKRAVRDIPPPQGNPEAPLRALIFDYHYDTYKGVIAYVRIVDGNIKTNESIQMMAVGQDTSAIEIGRFSPDLTPFIELKAGDIGYIATGYKEASFCRVGDTITYSQLSKERYTKNIISTEKEETKTRKHKNTKTHFSNDLKNKKSNKKYKGGEIFIVEPLPGYKEVKAMVYASLYPAEGEDYNFMRDSLEKLKLSDAAFTFEPESNIALGKGFRCGFLGLLHMEIIQARIKREFEIEPTITAPSVVYEIEIKNKKSKVKIYSPLDMPDPAGIEAIYEPFVNLDIITPAEYLGSIMELANNHRAIYKNTEYIDEERLILNFEIPLTEVIINFHDELKSVSSGFASMNYELLDYRKSDLVKLDILVAGDLVEAFSRIVPKERAYSEGKTMVEKLKEIIPRQNFAVPLQAAIGGNVIARETIRAFRKDVTAKLYGGDVTRKRKLLEKQKKGKKKMQAAGKVNIPSEAFLAALKK